MHLALSNDRLPSLALPFLGVLDVLVTTIAYLKYGELLSERNPFVKAIIKSHNLLLYYIWSVLYVLFLTFLARWLVSESEKAKSGRETAFGKLIRGWVRDPKTGYRYDPHHFYVVLHSCLIGLYVMIVFTNAFVAAGVQPNLMDNLATYVVSLFSTASFAYFLTKASPRIHAET